MRYIYKNCIGEKFNHLTITDEYEFRKPKKRTVKCKCDCGNYTWVEFSNVTSGHIKSCGCIYRKSLGESHTRFYNIYSKMNSRCNNKSESAYHLYGGRGIKCEWNSYEEFKNDMYDSYIQHVNEYDEKNTTIDRIDPNGKYCKENCQWATIDEQAYNKRNTRYIEMPSGKLINLKELSELTGININTLDSRYCRLDTEHTHLVKYNDIIKNEDIV